MPESTLNQIQKQGQRPTSDIIMMEAGRRLVTEVKKSTDSESSSCKTKHSSLKLPRSRSLDALSSPPLLEPEKLYDHDNDDASSVSISDDSSNGNNSAVLLKDEGPPSVLNDSSPTTSQKNQNQHVVGSTLLKEKSELNYANNNNNESYRNSSSRSSSISTSSSSSSNYSGTNHNKLGRRSSSTTTTTEGGSTAAAFQEVVLNEPIRITGYLEKRSKVLGWKKFWFVLDGRLLTYYKSKTDYESLSACCGCVNLGIATTVRPIQLRGCKGYPLQIATRSQVYYLRSPEKPVLEQWLLAIQEASSSPPSSSSLTSWLGSSSSQYFRHSFASQSQWSLNNSSEDITETDISGRLGNLPDTFYQKRDRGSLIYPSPPTVSQPSPVIHKCHSFASLQTSVVPFGGREGLYGRRVLLSSTENLRDLEEVGGGSRIKSATMQHSTSLLVLDSSPQAAELRKELTRKLSGGSSANAKPDGDEADKDQNGSNNVPTPKFLLLSGKKKPNVEQGGEGDEESHHYDEIGDFIVGKPHYENCDAEKANGGGSQPSSKRNSLLRGESAEKESNIYEHVETGESMSMSLESGMPAPVIWEPINDPSCANINKRFPPHRLSAGSNRNSLVSISEVPEDISSTSPSPIKTPVLSSIPESSWRSGVEPFKSYGKPYSEDELSSGRSESFRSLPCAEKAPKKRKGKAAIGGFFAKVFGKGKAKGVKADSQENLHKQMIITGPVDLRKQVQMKELPARKPPSGYPYKKSSSTTSTSSNKSNKTTSSSSSSANAPTTDKIEQQCEAPRTSPTIPGSRMTINNTNVMDELKQKVGHITLKRTSSRSSSGSDSELSPPKEPTKSNANNPPPSVEARVPYIPRTSTTSTTEMVKPAPVLILQMHDNHSESNTDDDIPIPEHHEKDVQSASMSIYQDSETSCSEAGTLPRAETKLQMVGMTVPPAPPLPKKSPVNEDEMDGKVITKSGIAPKHHTPPVVKRNPVKGDPETDFQTKLAKFNRLSQTLSANFIASLHPTHANHTFGSMTRSNSYKGRGKGNAIADDSLPPLPPKKKNAAGLISASTGMITLYDVPLNNKPVLFKGPQNSTDSLDDDQSQNRSEEKTIAAYIRDLTKKNSNPDIVLSGNGSKSIRLRDVMTDAKELRRTLDGSGSSDESLDVHKSSPSIPPGRPPKPKPPVKPKSLELGMNRIKRTSESSTSSESSSEQSQVTPTLEVPSQGFTVKILGKGYSPATSNKSLNIDDVLSDAGLSDTKASDSSPDSDNPSSSCPMHSTDFAYSTDAKTPESMMSFSDKIVPDSLATTPDTDITLGSPDPHLPDFGMDSDMEPMSINKLEIVIRDNDGSPGLSTHSPDNESRIDSLERRPGKSVSVTPSNSDSLPPNIYQNLKFATVQTLIQEFETVEENEDEVSELYDDFPSEFYTPTPSSFSGYSPSDISTTSSSDSSTLSMPSSSALKKHARIDAIRNSGMEQLEAFLNFGGTPSSDDYSFESCIDSSSEETSGTPPIPFNHNNLNNNVSKNKNPPSFMAGPQQIHSSGSQASNPGAGVNRTGAISRLGHSSAVGHLQKILTNDVKQNI